MYFMSLSMISGWVSFIFLLGMFLTCACMNPYHRYMFKNKKINVGKLHLLFFKGTIITVFAHIILAITF